MESNSNFEGVTLTFRLIRSFEHRNWKPLVLHNISLEITVAELKTLVDDAIKASKLAIPFKNFNYDCFKIEYQAHGFKTNDLLINTENDDTLILRPNVTLKSQGVKHETEISYFKLSDYKAYKESKLVILGSNTNDELV